MLPIELDDKDVEIVKLKHIIYTLRRLNPNIEKAFQEGIECERKRWGRMLDDIRIPKNQAHKANEV